MAREAEAAAEEDGERDAPADVLVLGHGVTLRVGNGDSDSASDADTNVVNEYDAEAGAGALAERSAVTEAPVADAGSESVATNDALGYEALARREALALAVATLADGGSEALALVVVTLADGTGEVLAGAADKLERTESVEADVALKVPQELLLPDADTSSEPV